MEFNPEMLQVQDRYKLLIGSITPRPIALVSTVSPEGLINLAPFSFFTGVGSDPMTVLFCPANNEHGQDKDTLRNCKKPPAGGTGEFVINLACEPYIRKVAGAAEPLAFGENEFDLVGLNMAPSTAVEPPRVAESPVCFECKTIRIMGLGGDNPYAGNIVIGRVMHVYVQDDLIDDKRRIDQQRLGTVGRMGGYGYCRTSDQFEITPGKAALEGE
ncbi:MAG: flavin reductase (DIM6/NTAB) family NADH-FMN oxidoreductase RutF [Phycisphaerales bacterium]|jgi:flavin reductase (DIM6/NTAB) family NADH-FMN oxidoreductase RutF